MNINKSGSQLVGHRNQKIMAYVACSEIGTVGGKNNANAANQEIVHR